MKPSFASPLERFTGASPVLRARPSHAKPSVHTSRPDTSSTRGRWLSTLPASLSVVREAALSVLSDVPADLAYLYHADDKVVIRAIKGDYQIRAEITPIDGRSTRIGVTCTREGEVDRAMSTDIVSAIEKRLS